MSLTKTLAAYEKMKAAQPPQSMMDLLATTKLKTAFTSVERLLSVRQRLNSQLAITSRLNTTIEALFKRRVTTGLFDSQVSSLFAKRWWRGGVFTQPLNLDSQPHSILYEPEYDLFPLENDAPA